MVLAENKKEYSVYGFNLYLAKYGISGPMLPRTRPRDKLVKQYSPM